MLRAGELDDREIELKLHDTGARHADLRDSRHARRQMGMINLSDMLGKAFGGGRTKTKKVTIGRQPSPAAGGGERQAARPGAGDGRGHLRGRAERHRLPRRDRQDLRPQRAHRRRRQPRGRAARSAAADRGHAGLDQAWAGEDRPYPVHRLGRLPSGQALRPAARAAGPPADPRRASGADPRRSEAHPDRARGQPDQAVQGAAGDREGDPRFRRPTPSTRWPISPPRSTAASRISARGACTR